MGNRFESRAYSKRSAWRSKREQMPGAHVMQEFRVELQTVALWREELKRGLQDERERQSSCTHGPHRATVGLTLSVDSALLNPPATMPPRIMTEPS